MKVYISGPIALRPDGNRKAFAEAAEKLRTMGHEPVDPHEVDKTHPNSWPCRGSVIPVFEGEAPKPHRYGCCMVPDLRALLECEGYTTLTEWETSRGATVEVLVAEICGLERIVM